MLCHIFIDNKNTITIEILLIRAINIDKSTQKYEKQRKYRNIFIVFSLSIENKPKISTLIGSPLALEHSWAKV
ncbi:MAG TPA: hypothetical protein DIW43_14865 [Spongiibacteraceae bacterium]|nr:hypothetical protein [Spongiibacteraceae bacterium]HCS28737.1 hypothetical protein [Spongiibacteraceae bacterium]